MGWGNAESISVIEIKGAGDLGAGLEFGGHAGFGGFGVEEDVLVAAGVVGVEVDLELRC